MTDYGLSTEAKVTVAQTKVLDKFCTRCRRHKAVEGGATLKAGSGQTRWVCRQCVEFLANLKAGGTVRK